MSGFEVTTRGTPRERSRAPALATLAALLPLTACYQPQALDARAVLTDLEQEQKAAKLSRGGMERRPGGGAAGLPDDASSGLGEDQAVALALKMNPDLRAARRQLGIAEGEVVAAGALKNPTVDLDVLHLEELATRKAWAVTLGWEPPQPEVRAARRAAASAQVDAVRQDIAEAEWQTAMTVRAAHTGLRAVSEDRALLESAIATRQNIGELVQKRMGGGASTRIDLIVAQLAVADTEHDRDEVRARELEAARLLGQLLGSVDPISATGAIVEDTRSPPALAKLVEAAMVTRPALVAEQARFAQREQTIRLQHALAWPWFKFTAAPRYRSDASQPQPNDFSVGVSVTVPLLDQNQGPVRIAEATRDQERELFRKVASTIHLEIQAALDKIAFRRRTLDRYRAVVLPGLTVHERLLSTAAAGGQLDVVAVLRAQDAILRARREYIELRLAHRQAWLDLERAVGLRIAGEGPGSPTEPATAPQAPARP